MTLALDMPAPGDGTLGRYKAVGPAQLPGIAHRYGLSQAEARAVRLHSMVLPFRVNSYVLDQLIDWSAVPEDPIYQLVFPQPGMLPASDLAVLAEQAGPRGSADELRHSVNLMRAPAQSAPLGQLELNVPTLGGPAAGGGAAQVRPDGAVLPGPGPDLPRLLHLLLPVGPVRR